MVNMVINMQDVRKKRAENVRKQMEKIINANGHSTKRIRQVEIAEKIDAALEEYYSERGMPVPQWKQRKDPTWWRDYLIDLGLDPHNP
ncbi:MAG: hypothetical protein CM15mV3_1120 [Caudoviricetes sp.]|nr:MAG: hypothetical protein CM15mV3_1120 [Caudoviricetes sp.]